MKMCIKCKELKDTSEFNLDKSRKDGLTPYCKVCIKPYSNRKYVRKKDCVLYKDTLLTGKKLCTGCKVTKPTRDFPINRSRKDGTQTYCIECTKQYNVSYRPVVSEKHALRKTMDLEYLLRKRLRTRLCEAVRKNYRSGSAVTDLGCSIQHLKLHLELFWDEGMSWENYGNKAGQWSIDHIKPLSDFDLSDRNQFLEAVHFTNLQPLWHVDNLQKHTSSDWCKEN